MNSLTAPLPAGHPASDGFARGLADALHRAGQRLQVMWEDAALIALDKPSGLLSVPGKGEAGRNNLLAQAQTRWPDAAVVHRLDMATSGLMLLARGAMAQRALSMAFERRAVHKTYTAWVHGVMEGQAGCIKAPLLADWPNRPRQTVDWQNGRPALTHWRVLERDAMSGRTRVLLEPVTGRSHQLRVHLQHLGHPIIGDELYAPPGPPQRLLLHATSLRLMHPISALALELNCPAPF
jgi:tRNA pseudouridine32 synthase / 23S rRNA pseudouridine746 synthase